MLFTNRTHLYIFFQNSNESFNPLKFSCFKNTFTTISPFAKLMLRQKRFTLLIKTRKTPCTRSSKRWMLVKINQIFIVTDINNNSSLNLVPKAAENTYSLKISFFRWSRIPNQLTQKICVIKRSILLWVWRKFNGHWDNNMIINF